MKIKNNETNNKIKEEIWNNYLGVLIFLIEFINFLHFYISNLKKFLTKQFFVFIYTFHINIFTFSIGCLTKLNLKKKNQKFFLSIIFLFIMLN